MSIYVQQPGAVIALGWLTLTESGAALEGAPAASACESMSRALMSLYKWDYEKQRIKRDFFGEDEHTAQG